MERQVFEGWRSRLERMEEDARSDFHAGALWESRKIERKRGGSVWGVLPGGHEDRTPSLRRVGYDAGRLAAWRAVRLEKARRQYGVQIETLEDLERLSKREYWANLPKAEKAERVARMVEYNRLYRSRKREKVNAWARQQRARWTAEQRAERLEKRREARDRSEEARFVAVVYHQLIRLAGLVKPMTEEQKERSRIYAQLRSLASKD